MNFWTSLLDMGLNIFTNYCFIDTLQSNVDVNCDSYVK